MRPRRHERFTRRKLKNVSMNRPETTNLNHQYIIRRVFTVLPSLLTVLPIAPERMTACDMLHIWRGRRKFGRDISAEYQTR